MPTDFSTTTATQPTIPAPAPSIYQLFNLAAAKRHIRSVLHGNACADLPMIETANRALQYLWSEKPWQWRRRLLSLDIAASTPTSYVRSSNVVTVVLTTHGLSTGSMFAITQSTAPNGFSFNGVFQVASVVDANTFTFNQVASDGTCDGTNGTSTGKLVRSYLVLPEDVGEIETLNGPPNTFYRVFPASMDEVIDRRRYYVTITDYFYCMSYRDQLTPDGEPRPVLEMSPVPIIPFTIGIPAIGFFTGAYFKRIPLLVNDSDVPNMPGRFGDIWLTLCRALAYSNETEQAGQDWAMYHGRIAKEWGDDANIGGPFKGRMVNTLGRRLGQANFVPRGNIQA